MQLPLAFLPSGYEWLWIFAIFFLLFGANKLPELARGLGRSIGEFKKAKNEFERELHQAVNEPPQTPQKPQGTQPASPDANKQNPKV